MVSTVDCQLLANRNVNGCINIVVVNQRQFSLATGNRAESLVNYCREASLYISGLPTRITDFILGSQCRCTNVQVDTTILSSQVKSGCWSNESWVRLCAVSALVCTIDSDLVCPDDVLLIVLHTVTEEFLQSVYIQEYITLHSNRYSIDARSTVGEVLL